MQVVTEDSRLKVKPRASIINSDYRRITASLVPLFIYRQ